MVKILSDYINRDQSEHDIKPIFILNPLSVKPFSEKSFFQLLTKIGSKWRLEIF